MDPATEQNACSFNSVSEVDFDNLRKRAAWWLALFWLVPGVLQGFGEYLGEGSAGLLFVLTGAAIALWGFVELGCLRGTEGPNAYGPDPLPPQNPSNQDQVRTYQPR